jgi:hypothetical protein
MLGFALQVGCGRLGYDPLAKPARDGGPTLDATSDARAAQEAGKPDAPGDGESGVDSGPPAIVLPIDVVLTGDANLDFGTDDGGGCRIVANGHSIVVNAPWVGHLHIKNCELEGLGSSTSPAIAVEVSGAGFVTIEGSTFKASGAIDIVNRDQTTTTFVDNVVTDSSVVSLDPDVDNSQPAFRASGDGTGPKTFKGNRIYRSSAAFESPNWLIGGDTARESNFIIGLGASFVLGSTSLVLRGNYVHNFRALTSREEFALAVKDGTNDVLAEHNVFRRGTWVVRGFGGEFRYNLVLDTSGDTWILGPHTDAAIHHDVFAMCAAPSVDVRSGIDVGGAKAATGVTVYNNTFDGGGTLMRMKGPAISVGASSAVASLRSNAFVQFPFAQAAGTAAIRGAASESDAPAPERLGYADYNLFFNPDATGVHNYALAVKGLTVRVDAGFGSNDARVGGPVDEQVDPLLTGTSNGCFPWSDEEIQSGRVTVSQILSAYRATYTPKASSPALGGGDPGDGAENFIGAVGAGTLDTDRFGRAP